MSDSIQSIRVVPQISNLKPNARAGDKKKKENNKEFSDHMSDNDTNQDGKGHNQVKANDENAENTKQNSDNSLHGKDDDCFDNGCGSLLDTEL